MPDPSLHGHFVKIMFPSFSGNDYSVFAAEGLYDSASFLGLKVHFARGSD